MSSKTAPTWEMRTVRRSQSLRAGTSIGKVGTLDAGSLRVEGGATQEVNCVLEGKSVWEKWRRRSVAVIPTRAMRRRERNREVVARYQALAFSPSRAVSRRSCASRDRMAGILWCLFQQICRWLVVLSSRRDILILARVSLFVRTGCPCFRLRPCIVPHGGRRRRSTPRPNRECVQADAPEVSWSTGQ